MTEQIEPKRGPGRPPLRDAKRTALRDKLRAKQVNLDDFDDDDRFAVPGAERHEGVSLQWKRFSVKGEQDPHYLASLRQRGWEPMTYEDFPEMAPDGETGAVIKDGMILMGRPKELTDEAERRLAARARKQIRDQAAQVGLAPAGTLPRVNQDMNGRKLGVQTEMLRQVVVED